MRTISIADFTVTAEQRRLINEILDSGRISEGPKVAAFEAAWAEFIGTRHCIVTNSGTSALLVGLMSLRHRLGLPRGAKAITPALSFIATSNAIWHAGFEPVYVDVDPIRFNMLPEQVAALLEAAPPGEYAALVPVHLMGYPAPLGDLLELSQRHGAPLVEDTAQAHGSLHGGRRLGSLGALGIFSFYISHNIQAGEMGAITTDDPELDALVRKFKDQGRAYRSADDRNRWFTHDLIGLNFKALEFQAALALPQVAEAEAIIRQRQHNVLGLNQRLAGLAEWLQLPPFDPDVSYLGYPLVVRRGAPLSRDALCDALAARGVETRPLFRSIPTQQPAYAHLREAYAGRLPTSEWLGLNGFYLGCHQYLTEADLDYMGEALCDIFAGREPAPAGATRSRK